MLDLGMWLNQGASYLTRQSQQEDLTGIDFYLLLGGNNTTVVGTDPVFARASVAYGEASQNVLTADSGSMRNLTGDRRGVMIETAHLGSITLYPNDYSNAYWEKGTRIDATAFANNEYTLPDGTTAASVEIKEGDAVGTHFIRTSSPVMTASTPYFASVFCKLGNTDVATRNAGLAFHGATAWSGDYTVVSLNFATGAVTEVTVGTPSLGTPVIEKGAVEMANGWWLLWAIATTGSDTVTADQNRHLAMLIKTTGQIDMDGNESSSVLFCKPQLIEADGFRASAVLDQTDTVIPHVSDVLSYAGSNYKQAYGNLTFDFYVDGVASAAADRMIYSAENATDHIKAYLDASGEFVFEIVTGGVTRTLTTAKAILSGRHQFSVDFGNESGSTSDVPYLDGAALALTTDVNTTAAPSTVDDIYIGQDSTGKLLEGSVQTVKVRDSRQGVVLTRIYSGGYEWIPNEATVTNELWYDADQLGLVDAASVTTWADLSGNSRTMTLPGGKTAPTFRLTGGANSKPAVEFEQFGNTVLQTGTWTEIVQPLHIFIILEQKGWAASRGIFALHSTSGSSWLLQIGTSPEVVLRSTTSGPSITEITLGSPHLAELFMSGAASTAIVDDGEPLTGTVGTVGMDSFTLGALYSGGNNSEVTVSEVIAYSAEMTGADLTSLRNYINTKYGIETR